MNICTAYLTLKTDKNGIALLTLNRPQKHNALNENLITELIHLLEEINNSERIHALILTGKGDSFCSGADLNDMRTAHALPPDENQKKASRLAKLPQTLYHLNKPTIALVNGPAFGAGVGLIACCDIALAANKNVHFCFSEVQFHLTPAVISPYIIKAIGQRHARYYFLSGQSFDVEEAQHMGLIHSIYAKNKLLDKAEQLAQQLAQTDPEAIQEIKQLTKQDHLIEENLVESYATRLAQRRVSPKAQQALTQFYAKKQERAAILREKKLV